MHQMIELHPKADALDMLGLPSIPYPVALPAFQAAVANDGELPLADMLHGLQLRAAEARDWERLEPAMTRLAELLAADDARETVTARGDDWWLEIGQVDLRNDVIALQRGQSLLAMVCDRGDGRLRMATWRPLDARAIGLLVDLALVPDATPGNGDARTSWERAMDAVSRQCHPMPAVTDQACLSHWRRGAGSSNGHSALPEWHSGAEQPIRRPATVAAEIATWCALHEPRTAINGA